MLDNLITIGRGSAILGFVIGIMGVYGCYHLLRLILDHSQKASENWENPTYGKFVAYLLLQVAAIACLVLIITA